MICEYDGTLFEDECPTCEADIRAHFDRCRWCEALASLPDGEA